MPLFRKISVTIEAFRLGFDNMPDWFCDARNRNDVTTHNIDGRFRGGPDYALIKTLEGEMRCDYGNYVIKGVQGELYPCRADIFNSTYEAVE